MTSLIDFETVGTGDRFSLAVAEELLRAQIVQYAGASGDFHPFHIDEVHARAHGFDAVFAHGMLTMGLTGRLVSELAGDAAVRNYRAEMRRQVWPGDTLEAVAIVTDVRTDEGATTVVVDLETRNQNDELVLQGSAVVFGGG